MDGIGRRRGGLATGEERKNRKTRPGEGQRLRPNSASPPMPGGAVLVVHDTPQTDAASPICRRSRPERVAVHVVGTERLLLANHRNSGFFFCTRTLRLAPPRAVSIRRYGP